MGYLKEAFSSMEDLDQDLFSVDADGLRKLDAFEKQTANDEPSVVIDPKADDESDIKDSYVGKILTRCVVCQSDVLRDESELKTEEGSDVVNIEDTCPMCQSNEGYKIIGVIAPYGKHPDDQDDDSQKKDATDDVKDQATDADAAVNDDTASDTKQESLKEGRWEITIPQDLANKFRSACEDESDNCLNLVKSAMEDIVKFVGTQNEDAKDDLEDTMEEWAMVDTDAPDDLFNEDDIDDDTTNRDYVDTMILEPFYDTLDAYRIWIPLAESAKSSTNGLKEDVNNVQVSTTDGQTVEVTPEGDETTIKIKKTEPQTESNNDGEGELIQPISKDKESEINKELNKSDEDEPDVEDIDFDEFDENQFDDLGESFLKEVYDNVDSYKTVKGSVNQNRLKLEGVIKFKSGKSAPTTFLFESANITKTGKLKLIGENVQFAKTKNAFTLTGRQDGKRLVVESLNYRYSAKDSTGKTKQLYGTVTR